MTLHNIILYDFSGIGRMIQGLVSAISPKKERLHLRILIEGNNRE